MNVAKLSNLKKRLQKNVDTNDIYLTKIIATIDECLIDAKKIAKEKDKDNRINYKMEKIRCTHCGAEVLRDNIYKHYKSKKCGYKSNNIQKDNLNSDIILQNILTKLERPFN